MNVSIGDTTLEVQSGDLTKLEVDAIVNAANGALLGGGGVDGAIHKAAGPGLLEECRTLGGCEIGDAKLTMGYELPARYVIHTVGPVWNGGGSGEPGLLASCYRKSMEIAVARHFMSIAFPAISTGIYNYPVEPAARIAVDVVRDALEDSGIPMDVTFCCFSEGDLSIYKAVLIR
jgi:O-acetyl-ADP-ribose deacetylase (regulator of RNase III)